MKQRTVMNQLSETGRTGGYIKVFSHDVSGGLFTNYDVGNKNPEEIQTTNSIPYWIN